MNINNTPGMKLYVDMDGVLADFDGQFEKTHGSISKIHEDNHGKEDFWDKVYSDPDFFRTLPLFDYTLKFWDSLTRFTDHIIILSSPSRRNTEKCVQDKKDWVAENLCLPDGRIPFSIFEKNKYLYASPNSILIDDTEEKLDAWDSAGGISIHHDSKNWEHSLACLKHVQKTGLGTTWG